MKVKENQNITNEDFVQGLKEIADELMLENRVGQDFIKIEYSGWTGIQLIILIRDNKIEFYFWVRTNSWHYIDERTDIHDSVSVLLSGWCKINNGFASALYDVTHPVMPELSSFEVYARYIVPSQIPQEYIDLTGKDTLSLYRHLIMEVWMFEKTFWNMFGGCPCAACKKALNLKYEFKNKLGKRLQTKIDQIFDEVEDYNLKDRQFPTWKYYRNFNKGISIIYSETISKFLRSLSSSKENIESVNGELLVEGFLRHFVPEKIKNDTHRIFKVLEHSQRKEINYLVLENKIIAIGDRYSLVFDADSGLQSFKTERDILKNRHNKEYHLLFKPSEINWATKIDDSDFEDLIAELLRREPNVSHVRKVSHTNESDGKKDLIIDLKVLPNNYQKLPEEINPYSIIKVIVQCKAYQKAVSKSDVTDIRDTIEDYNYNGFLLVVSSYTTRNLTEHLDKLRNKNQFWIDWWTKQEIEEKLKLHEDLLFKFPRVFTVS